MAKKSEQPAAYLVTPEEPTFNLLVYGDSGKGKTTFAASAQDHPRMKNVLIANIEGGTLSIAHRKDIHAIDIKSTKQMEDLAWAIAQGDYPSVNTLVIDNITELQTRNLAEIVNKAISQGRNKVKNRERTEDDLFMEDYKTSGLQLGRLFRFVRDLPINLILTAHAKRVYPRVPEGTDLTNIDPIAIVPSLTTKLMEATLGYMDFVWCLEFDSEPGPDDPERFALTVDQGAYRCKTRGPRFFEKIGPIIESPSLPEIYDAFVATAHDHPKPKARKR